MPLTLIGFDIGKIVHLTELGNMVDELNHKLHDGNVESAMIIIINKDGGFEYTMSSNIPYLTAIGLLDSFKNNIHFNVMIAHYDE